MSDEVTGPELTLGAQSSAGRNCALTVNIDASSQDDNRVMRSLYDTRTVSPLDRYAYYQAQATGEQVPVEIRGRTPGRILAAMDVTQVEEFQIGVFTWVSDGPIVAHRTQRHIRAYDPDCYRLLLSLNGGIQTRQAEHAVVYRPRDMGFYDMSRPFENHPPAQGPDPTQSIILTFPRALLDMPAVKVQPLVGTAFPHRQPQRSLLAELLVELVTGNSDGAGEVLRACVIGLIRARLGQPSGIGPDVLRRVHLTRIRTIAGRRLNEPDLNPERLATAAGISTRYAHAICTAAGTTPRKLLTELRMAAAHRYLEEDPEKSIRAIAAAVGYPRPDQFAHDFRNTFGMSARDVRRAAS